MADNRDRSRFRLATSRREELTMQQELDDVGKKSMAEIIVAKETRRITEAEHPQETLRKLAPEFNHQRVLDKRKSQVVFHDDLEPSGTKTGKYQYHPMYNALDKEVSSIMAQSNRTRRLPFSKEDTCTTEDMRKPRVTSLGVLPADYSQPVINVVLTGQAAKQHDDPVLGPVQRANTLAPQVYVASPRTPLDVCGGQQIPGKPAIVGSLGTAQTVKFIERPTPPSKPMTRLKAPRVRSAKSASSTASSFMSVDINLPDEQAEYHDVLGQLTEETSQGRSSLYKGTDAQRSTSSAMNSVKDLLEDAKKIATPEAGSTAVLKARRKQRRESISYKLQTSASQKPLPVDKRKKKKEEQPDTERSVDEIITSLKEQAKSGVVSEADRKIQEIMDRVIARPSATLSNITTDDDPSIAHAQEPSSYAIEASKEPDPIEVQQGSDEPLNDTAEKIDPAESEEGNTTDLPTIVEPTADEQPEIIPQDEMIEKALEQIAEAKAAEKAQSNAEEDEDNTTTKSLPDLSQAWNDLMAPSEVAYEDIISIGAKKSKLHPKHSTEHEDKTKPATVSKSYVSLLGSWTPAQDDTEKEVPRSAGITRESGHQKGIHHFCTQTDDIQLPDHYRGVWRRYHVPSKFDSIYKDTKLAVMSPDPPVQDQDQDQDAAVLERELLNKHQAQVAQKILEDASKIKPDDGVDEWRHRAQEVFDRPDMEVSGTKMELRSDESFLYWTPAPPKWDVPPKQVKEALFPLYHGAMVDAAVDMNTVQQDTDESDDDNELQACEEDIDDRMARERTLLRQHSSALDLTDLSKALLDENERNTPQRTRAIHGQLTLPDDKFTDQLQNPQSAEYAAKKTAIEEMLKNVISHALTDQYRGLGLTSFSGGSLVVHYSVLVSETAPPGLGDVLHEALELAVKRGVFGDLVIDVESIAIHDDVKTKADLLKRKLSQMANYAPIVSPYKMAGRREVSDLTGIIAHPVLTDEGVIEPRERRHSAPGCMDCDDDDLLIIYQDYNTAMEELAKQKKQLLRTKGLRKKRLSIPEEASGALIPDESGVKNSPRINFSSDIDSVAKPDDVKKHNFPFAVAYRKEADPTPAELALAAGRAYVLMPNKKKKKKIPAADLDRIDAIQAFVSQRPTMRERRSSFSEKARVIERSLRVPQRIRQRINSLPAECDFEEFKRVKKCNVREKSEEREWARDIWDNWFEEVYPTSPDPSDWAEEADDPDEQPSSVVMPDKPTKRKSSIASVVYSENIELDPVIDKDEENDSVAMLQEEVEKLDEEIEASKKPNAFNLCRRGAILRKLGRIKPALDDLSLAIELEPMMLDAFWHRHLVYILLNKKQAALDDLNIVLKYNKSHVGAYKSRAALYYDQKDITMSIINYTQAVKFHPDDDDAYFRRAELYEERGETLLAMEDYSTAFKINPQNTDALFRHGMHYYNNENWQNAIADFSELLKYNPYNVKARLFRGCTYAQLEKWNEAVQDLSAAIHLDPRNAKAYYYRACLLRKLHPKKALQDFSVSLLLDDSEDNILSYLHRAILYNEIGRHEDAIPDFEAVLKLDKDVACAHVDLGLIYMLKIQNFQRAIKKFSAAIKADPTYVKAYICRAEAYTKVHDVKNALLDITRAIHLKPDLNHLYMYRGQLVLKMGNLELAAFCVKHAADLNAGLGHSPTQQAIVQSFLKNYDKAIEALESATKVKPLPPLFMLLGKTRMKARQWNEAVEAFQQALELVKPWQDKHTWPPESAEMFYLVGMCQLEKRDYFNAHDAFNNAIQVDKKLAEAYYWRGMTRIKLKQSKGIQDFNRALALDPTLFQAYLSRAAYYGLKSKYTKGILNCNEAIRLQPTSLRGYLYRGAMKYHIKAYTLAIRDLSEAIAIDSTCALAYFNRAVCYHDSGNFIKALQDYGIVLLLGDFLSLKVLINRGLLYFEMKDYKNALQDFLLSSTVNPNDKSIHHTLGLCYHKLNRLEEAVRSLTRALKLDQFFLDALISRGNVFMDFGHEIGHTYARHDYERALHLNPHCLPARVNLAYNLQVAGKFQQAWHQFTAAISVNNRFQPALEGRAVINLQMSDTFAAFQDINQSVNIHATAELLTNRGVIHQFMGDKVNAMRDYQKAVLIDTTYSLAYFNAANVYFHSRQFKQALAYFNLAIRHNNKDESAHLNRAITKVMLKDAPGALADFEVAIKLSPKSAHIYFNRGNLYTSLQIYDQAEQDYTKALELCPDDPLVHMRRADVRGKLGRKQDAIADYQHAILVQSMLSEKK